MLPPQSNLSSDANRQTLQFTCVCGQHSLGIHAYRPPTMLSRSCSHLTIGVFGTFTITLRLPNYERSASANSMLLNKSRSLPEYGKALPAINGRRGRILPGLSARGH